MLKFFQKVGPQVSWLASTSLCVKACMDGEMSLRKEENEYRQKGLMTKRTYEPQTYRCPAGGVLLTHKESVVVVDRDTSTFSPK